MLNNLKLDGAPLMSTKSRLFCLVISVLLLTACGTDQESRTNRDMAEQAASRALAAEKRAAEIAEKNRQTEQELKRRQEDWERDRQTREAKQREEILQEAKRRADAELAERERRAEVERQERLERQRREDWLTWNCPKIWIARQLCASAGSNDNYQSCMYRRIPETYSPRNDSDCQARR